MRSELSGRTQGVLAVLGLALGVAFPADASKLLFTSQFFTELGASPSVPITGTGVATVNGSSGGNHLNALRLADLSGSAIVPITDPVVTAAGLAAIAVTGTDLGPDTLAPISGGLQNTTLALTQNVLAVKGTARICLISPDCSQGFLSLNLTTNNGNTGVGIGGLLTIGGAGAIRVSLVANPWTIKTVTLTNRSNNGTLTFPTRAGFAHGPASLTSSTNLASGVVSVVAPIQVTTIGVPGNTDTISLFNTLTLHFIPEPGLLLLLGAGTLGLAALGRRRMKR